jgi:hypothetical protein
MRYCHRELDTPCSWYALDTAMSGVLFPSVTPPAKYED